MHGRGGFPAKNIIFAVFIVLLIYMTYLYNGSQNRLREVEMTAARYKREADDRTTEIQDLVRAKDKAQENWQNEKFELNNRIKSINQQHSLLQGQYKEVEADLSKLKDDMDKMNLDNKDSQKKHHEEYILMKQTKENEISSCRDELANTKRKSDELSGQVATLQDNLQKYQKLLENTKTEARNYFQHLEQANADLKREKNEVENRLKELEGQPKNEEPRGEQKQQHAQVQTTKLPQSLFQQREEQPNAFQKNSDVELMKMQKDEKDNPFNQFDSLPAFDKKNPMLPVNVPGREGGDGQDQQKADVEELNAKNQVLPPVHNQPLANDDELVRNGVQEEKKDLDKKEVNPNDEQKVQIQEPVLGLPEKDKEDAGLYGFERDKKDDENDKFRMDDDGGEAEHKNPLALGQIQGPQPGAVNANNDQRHVGHPPIVNEHNDNVGVKNANVGENQYFGEEDNQQIEGGDEDGRGVEDDQDRDGRLARDADNQDQLQENENAALDRANE